MRAILVSVDYADILAITLPYNRHHFDEVMVVTTFKDAKTQQIATENGAQVYATNSFFYRGAQFNKWKALEEGLDAFGRDGWLCIMDADILWPTVATLPNLQTGYLYTPWRRLHKDVTKPIPSEKEWTSLPRFKEVEFAGYSQIFHASDSVLGCSPWHQTDWLHAGGADSFFQRKWLKERKIRPAFEVLHLGSPGVNWCGRVSPKTDGSKDPKSEERNQQMHRYMAQRRRTRRYNHERYR